MEDTTAQFKQLKTALLCMLVVFLFPLSAIILITKDNFKDSLQKEARISLLINEVGELKQANDELLTAVEIKNQKMLDLYSKMTSNSLQKNQSELNSLLQDKEKTINELALKNKEMSAAINLPDYDETILDFLILGQNSGLTDTIIIASINPATQKITLISLPRDLYYKGRKINELYNMYGLEKLQEAVLQITGVKIDKYVVLDFEAFVAIIDALGGIEVDVEKAIVDELYPGPNYTYKTVSFDAGVQHMDGQTALEYSRSRKSTSDFARSERQQQIIQLTLEKARAADLLNRLDISLKLYQKTSEHLTTDMNLFEALGYLNSYKDYTVKTNNVINNQNYLYSTKSASGQYILLPKNKSFAAIHTYVFDLINK